MESSDGGFIEPQYPLQDGGAGKGSKTLGEFLKAAQVPQFFHTGFVRYGTVYLPPLLEILDDKYVDVKNRPVELLKFFMNEAKRKTDPEEKLFIIESTVWLYTLCYFYIFYDGAECGQYDTGLFKGLNELKDQNLFERLRFGTGKPPVRVQPEGVSDARNAMFIHQTKLSDGTTPIRDIVANCLFMPEGKSSNYGAILLESVFSICLDYGKNILSETLGLIGSVDKDKYFFDDSLKFLEHFSREYDEVNPHPPAAPAAVAPAAARADSVPPPPPSEAHPLEIAADEATAEAIQAEEEYAAALRSEDEARQKLFEAYEQGYQEDGMEKEEAATRIQALFRGQRVRRIIAAERARAEAEFKAAEQAGAEEDNYERAYGGGPPLQSGGRTPETQQRIKDEYETLLAKIKLVKAAAEKFATKAKAAKDAVDKSNKPETEKNLARTRVDYANPLAEHTQKIIDMDLLNMEFDDSVNKGNKTEQARINKLIPQKQQEIGIFEVRTTENGRLYIEAAKAAEEPPPPPSEPHPDNVAAAKKPATPDAVAAAASATPASTPASVLASLASWFKRNPKPSVEDKAALAAAAAESRNSSATAKSVADATKKPQVMDAKTQATWLNWLSSFGRASSPTLAASGAPAATGAVAATGATGAPAAATGAPAAAAATATGAAVSPAAPGAPASNNASAAAARRLLSRMDQLTTPPPPPPPPAVKPKVRSPEELVLRGQELDDSNAAVRALTLDALTPEHNAEIAEQEALNAKVALDIEISKQKITDAKFKKVSDKKNEAEKNLATAITTEANSKKHLEETTELERKATTNLEKASEAKNRAIEYVNEALTTKNAAAAAAIAAAQAEKEAKEKIIDGMSQNAKENSEEQVAIATATKLGAEEKAIRANAAEANAKRRLETATLVEKQATESLKKATFEKTAANTAVTTATSAKNEAEIKKNEADAAVNLAKDLKAAADAAVVLATTEMERTRGEADRLKSLAKTPLNIAEEKAREAATLRREVTEEEIAARQPEAEKKALQALEDAQALLAKNLLNAAKKSKSQSNSRNALAIIRSAFSKWRNENPKQQAAANAVQPAINAAEEAAQSKSSAASVGDAVIDALKNLGLSFGFSIGVPVSFGGGTRKRLRTTRSKKIKRNRSKKVGAK